MRFRHADTIWADHPELAAGVVYVDGVGADRAAPGAIDRYAGMAADRLAGRTESELAEIKAWRRTFAGMGLKPTQYRCAAESLLRRFRRDGTLPTIHPVIDLCNAASLAYAIPIAVLDLAAVTGNLEVRYASGDERYVTFGGETEHPAPGEVTYVDDDGWAHARRWTNRQSGRSAVSAHTGSVLVVAEAVHDTAAADVPELIEDLRVELALLGGVHASYLTADRPEYTVAGQASLPA